MGDYENFINGAIDNDKEATFSYTDKQMAFMVQQAMKSLHVVEVDETTTAGTVYLQFASGSIHKWVNDVSRYVADNGTLWADRVTAIYSAEKV